MRSWLLSTLLLLPPIPALPQTQPVTAPRPDLPTYAAAFRRAARLPTRLEPRGGWVLGLDTLIPPSGYQELHDLIRRDAHRLVQAEARYAQYIGTVPGICYEGQLSHECGDPERAYSPEGRMLRFQYGNARARFSHDVKRVGDRLDLDLAPSSGPQGT